MGYGAEAMKVKQRLVAKHLYKIVQPNLPIAANDDAEFTNFLESPCQMDFPISRISNSEVSEEILRTK